MKVFIFPPPFCLGVLPILQHCYRNAVLTARVQLTELLTTTLILTIFNFTAWSLQEYLQACVVALVAATGNVNLFQCRRNSLARRGIFGIGCPLDTSHPLPGGEGLLRPPCRGSYERMLWADCARKVLFSVRLQFSSPLRRLRNHWSMALGRQFHLPAAAPPGLSARSHTTLIGLLHRSSRSSAIGQFGGFFNTISGHRAFPGGPCTPAIRPFPPLVQRPLAALSDFPGAG